MICSIYVLITGSAFFLLGRDVWEEIGVCTRVGVFVTREMAEFCGCDAVDVGKYDGVHVGGLPRFLCSDDGGSK